MASGQGMRVDPHKLLLGTRAILGFHLESLLSHPALLEDSVRRLFQWFASGRLQVQGCHRLPLREARAAYELIEQRRNTGKVVLTMAGYRRMEEQ